MVSTYLDRPKADGAVEGAGRKTPAIRTEVDAVDWRAVVGESEYAASSSGIPDAHRAVTRATTMSSAICTKQDKMDSRGQQHRAGVGTLGRAPANARHTVLVRQCEEAGVTFKAPDLAPKWNTQKIYQATSNLGSVVVGAGGQNGAGGVPSHTVDMARVTLRRQDMKQSRNICSIGNLEDFHRPAFVELAIVNVGIGRAAGKRDVVAPEHIKAGLCTEEISRLQNGCGDVQTHMKSERLAQCTSGGIPDDGAVVESGRDKEGTLTIPSHSTHGGCMSRQFALQVAQVVPKPGTTIGRCRRKQCAGRVPVQGRYFYAIGILGRHVAQYDCLLACALQLRFGLNLNS